MFFNENLTQRTSSIYETNQATQQNHQQRKESLADDQGAKT